MLAMRRAVQALGVQPEEAWVDGNHCPGLLCKTKAIVDGDALHPVISAASILAKTERDAEMCALSARFPQYGFDRHKGYATSSTSTRSAAWAPGPTPAASLPRGGASSQRPFSDGWGAMAETAAGAQLPHVLRRRKLACPGPDAARVQGLGAAPAAHLRRRLSSAAARRRPIWWRESCQRRGRS